MFVIQLLVLIGSNGGGLLSTVHLPAFPRETGTWGHVPALYFHMNRTHHPLDKQQSPVLSQARGEHRSAQTSATDAAKITPSPVRALCWEETFIGPDSPAWQHKERQGDGYSLFSLWLQGAFCSSLGVRAARSHLLRCSDPVRAASTDPIGRSKGSAPRCGFGKLGCDHHPQTCSSGRRQHSLQSGHRCTKLNEKSPEILGELSP